MLKGHSGFKLSVVEDDGGYVFQKSGDGDTSRLFRQMDRQIKYRDIINKYGHLSSKFYVPSVVDRLSDGFNMEYIYGRHLLDVVSECNVSIIGHIMDNILFWVDWCIDHSGRVSFDPRFFSRKLETIKGVDELLKKFDVLLDGCKGLDCPVGYCHGDFTLSNMLFLENGKIGLVDWHDPFMESPLQDIGKLFQEIELKWSMRMGDTSAIKFDTAYDNIHRFFDRWIETIDVEPRLVHLFHVMTLLRLFPYTKHGELYDIIYDCVEELL